MPAFKADPRGKTISTPRGSVRFNPEGKLEWHGKRPKSGVLKNPADVWGGPTFAARFFVGFNVGGQPRWELDDLVALVRATREGRGEPQDSTYIAQRGVFTHRDGKVVDEAGGQVIIFDQGEEQDESARMARFQEEMIAVGEEIARGLEQESVILEIQRNGVSLITMGVRP